MHSQRRLALVALLALAALAATVIGFFRPRSKTSAAALQESHRWMLAALGEIERNASDHWLLGDKDARDLRRSLAEPSPGASPVERCRDHYRLGDLELRLGREVEAIAAFTEAYRLLAEARAGLRPGEAADVVFYLGVAYMRLGERQNCCHRNTPESCLLPLEGGGIHTNPQGSRQAIRYFTEVLRGTRGNDAMHLRARWLLNIAYMTLGEHPAGVPAEHLIPQQAFAAETPFPRFANVAGKLGVDVSFNAGGAIGDDFDNDGNIDLMVSSSHLACEMRYFRNQGDGSFEDRTHAAGLAGIRGGLNMVQADYNNDGNLDVLVLRGGWFFESGRHPRSLLRNNGDGTFVDAAFAAGLCEAFYPTQTGSWADYDNDGDLDLFIGNESSERVTAPSQLFRNNGDESFTDVAREAGVTNHGFAKAAVWGDHDGDGWPDIYVGNLRGPNRLYRNRGDGTFIDVAQQLGVTRPQATFPCWFWDYNNDGALDIAAFSYAGEISDLAAHALGIRREFQPPGLYRGDGKGRFTEVTEETGLKRPILPMGANFGDLDGDGYLDFYLGTGDPDFMSLMPNLMYLNRGGTRFADVTTAGGFGHLQKGHAVVFADFDNDGDQDVFEQMGGAYPGDRFPSALYENPGFGNRWLAVKLVGVTSNRAAIGARIRVVIFEDGKERSIYRHIGSGGTFGGNPLRQFFGLGQAAEIARLEVLWPTTGRTQTCGDVPIDSAVEIIEGSESWRHIPLRRSVLGGAAAQ